MQPSPSTNPFQGMRLSEFRRLCAHEGNPFQRQKIQGHPFWTTPEGKIIWLKAVPVSNALARYELDTCTLEEYCQKPLIQRGVAHFDDYHPPEQPDTPLLKRRAEIREHIQSTRIFSSIPSRPSSPVLRTRIASKTIPESQRRANHRSSQQLPSVKAQPSQPNEADSAKPSFLRLIENVSEIASGSFPDRVRFFMLRAAREMPVSPEQTKNRWFGMNKSGHLVMTRSSWFSLFFPNKEIRRFIQYYAPSLAKRIQKINVIRRYYNLPPLKVTVPSQERHCHAEVLQKQLDSISAVTHKGFQDILKKSLGETFGLIYHFPHDPVPIPPLIVQKLKQNSQLVQDWMQCTSPSEHSNIIDMYMRGIWEITHDPGCSAQCPRLMAEITRLAPVLLQQQMPSHPPLNQSNTPQAKQQRQSKGQTQ